MLGAQADVVGGALVGQLRDLRAVAAAGVEHRQTGHVAEQLALRRPLDESIERVLAGPGLLEPGGELLPRPARVA